MRKRVKKQLREQEKGRYKDALDNIRRLEVDVANFLRTLQVSNNRILRLTEENKKLSAMFEGLQKEYEELQVASAHDIQAVEANSEAIAERNNELAETIYELKRPWWRKWWERMKDAHRIKVAND